MALQMADDGEQVARLWVTGRAEHADQALGRRPGLRAKPFEADRCLDVVTQNRLAAIYVAGKHGLDAFLEQCIPEFRIGLDTRQNRFLEISR